MSRTLVRQDTQVHPSGVYDDTVASGSGMESATLNAEDDFNALRSQVLRLLGQTNWYDALYSRSLRTADIDLADIEAKRFLFRSQKVIDIAVPALQNWVVLSVAGSEAPSEVAAVDAATTNGAVVAFHTGTFGTHSLDEVGGATTISPKNLCIVRDGLTGQIIQSSGRDVYALIQSEIVTNGHTFNDTTQRVQLSFVRENATHDDLEACPVADIAGKTINYSYVRRINLDSIPEDAYLSGVWVDLTGATDVTLDNAIDNQSGPATQTQSIQWRISDTFTLKFQDSPGTRDLFALLPTAGGDTAQFNVDTFDVNNVNDADFLNGAKFDTGGVEIDIGSTAIASTGTIETTGSNDLRLLGARELFLDDGNQVGSTWAQTNGIKLSDTTAEWDAFETAFGGEVSLLAAITSAKTGAVTRSKTVGVVTAATIAKDANVTGAPGSPNIDAQLGNYTGKTFVTDVDVYLNGVLLRNGANAAANHDVYPGNTISTGDLKFEFVLKINDVITMIIW